MLATPVLSMNTVGYTCQVTAAFRAVELTNNAEPIIRDPLAVHLAGEALPRAQQDWQQLVAAQGPGKSLRIPARNRVMDDLLLQALQKLAVSYKQQPLQVVNVGCGMVSTAAATGPQCVVGKCTYKYLLSASAVSDDIAAACCGRRTPNPGGCSYHW